MLYEAILIALVIGLVTKGSLKQLAKLELKAVYLVFLAFSLKAGLELLAYKGYFFPYQVVMLVQFANYVLLFIFLYINYHLPGRNLIVIGFLLNFIVIMANHGTMPADLRGMEDTIVSAIRQQEIPTYSALSEKTRMPWLADIMLQKFPEPKRFSIGDVFISIGVFYLVWSTMRTKTAT